MSSIWLVRRSASDAKIAGVCGGLAAHWGVDAVLVRVGMVLLGLTGGIGVVLYLAGWLLVPVQGRTTATIDETFGSLTGRLSREIWVAIVVVACAVTFAVFGSFTPFGLAPALVAALVWYFGFHRGRARRTTPPPAVGPPPPPIPYVHPGPPTPFTEAAYAWQARVHEVRTEQARTEQARTQQATSTEYAAYLAAPDPVGLYAEPEPTPAAVVRPGTTPAARRLRLVTVLVLGLTLGALAIADASGVAISLSVYAAAALLVVGLALVAATWFGRARGLLGVGIALGLTTVVATSGLAGPMAEAYGTRQVAYTQVAQLPSTTDQLDAGELTVDLHSLPVTDATTYRAHVDTGQLSVRVPAGTGVRLHYVVDLGQVDALGTTLESGTDLAGTRQLVPAAAGQPTLDLELSVDQGRIQVTR